MLAAKPPPTACDKLFTPLVNSNACLPFIPLSTKETPARPLPPILFFPNKYFAFFDFAAVPITLLALPIKPRLAAPINNLLVNLEAIAAPPAYGITKDAA